MSLTKPSEYNGTVTITKNKYDQADLQDYLDELEPLYLKDLLGCELYELFIADLDGDGVPQTERFTKIYDAFCYDLNNIWYPYGWNKLHYNYYILNQQNRSRGIIAMLKGFMFFEYTRDQAKLNSSIGTSTSDGVASTLRTALNTSAVKNYNKALVDYWNIQYYICKNSEIYPEYEGVFKYATGLI